jgi:hypothetical protein
MLEERLYPYAYYPEVVALHPAQHVDDDAGFAQSLV